MGTVKDRKYLRLWRQYAENVKKATPVDLNEDPVAKIKRIAELEKDDERWFKYYFPNHYTSDPTDWQKASSKRVMSKKEYYLVRSWSRELSKTTRTRFEVIKKVLTGVNRNTLMISDTESNAQRFLLPYKVQLESNDRIINDYGDQKNLGQWEAGEFVTLRGASFRAIGAGQNPRGANNDAVRPDCILIEDIDTDEEVRNPERIKKKVKWLTEAVYATRSISLPLLWIACGNIIAKYCSITEMAKVADRHEVINIRDEDGKSTWPERNTEENIDRVLSKMPWSAQQKEYFNNPVTEGDTFKTISFGTVPQLKRCNQVIIYADPSTSNKDRGRNKQASYKGVVIVGALSRKRYLYKCWLDQTSNSTFVDWLYEAYLYCKDAGVDTVRVYIENNSLQDPFYQQVILPLIYKRSSTYGFTVPVTEDKRKKPDKYYRIEGTLEPLNRLGNLVFNKKEDKDPHMVKMHDQMLGVSPQATVMDGPDALEGGCWLIQNRVEKRNYGFAVGKIDNRRF